MWCHFHNYIISTKLNSCYGVPSSSWRLQRLQQENLLLIVENLSIIRIKTERLNFYRHIFTKRLPTPECYHRDKNRYGEKLNFENRVLIRAISRFYLSSVSYQLVPDMRQKLKFSLNNMLGFRV